MGDAGCLCQSASDAARAIGGGEKAHELKIMIGRLTMAKWDQCLRCNQQMTWAEQRRQFGRLIRYGWTPEEAKRLTPRCQKCVTEPSETEEQQPVMAVVAVKSHAGF